MFAWLLNVHVEQGWKVGYSDPIILSGKIIAQWIKGTLGITG